MPLPPYQRSHGIWDTSLSPLVLTSHRPVPHSLGRRACVWGWRGKPPCSPQSHFQEINLLCLGSHFNEEDNSYFSLGSRIPVVWQQAEERFSYTRNFVHGQIYLVLLLYSIHSKIHSNLHEVDIIIECRAGP